ncbi:MAG: ABC transporter ATP-binding protein, partial [Planctomycetota bacterium]
MSDIIEIKNLNFRYTQQCILKNFSFEVSENSFVAIAGPNGAGKSTLLNLVCRQLKSKSGAIKIDGKLIESYSPRKLARKIAIVHQEFVPVFDFTVAEIVMMGRTPYLSSFGYETKTDMEIVTEALKLTETDVFASRPLINLSGGERQRVLIARALA